MPVVAWLSISYQISAVRHQNQELLCLSIFLVSAVAVASLSGCVNTDSLSGDTYTAGQAKQVQTVSYGTIVSVRPVNIQAGSNENVLGAIGGAVLGGLVGNTIGGG